MSVLVSVLDCNLFLVCIGRVAGGGGERGKWLQNCRLGHTCMHKGIAKETTSTY